MGGRVAHGEHTRVTDDLIMGRLFRRGGRIPRMGPCWWARRGLNYCGAGWRKPNSSRVACRKPGASRDASCWLWIVSDVWRRGGALAETIQGAPRIFFLISGTALILHRFRMWAILSVPALLMTAAAPAGRLTSQPTPFESVCSKSTAVEMLPSVCMALEISTSAV